MTLSLTASTPAYFQDAGAPLASYTSQSVIIRVGQFYLNNTNNDIYICTDSTSQAALVWHKIPREDQLAALQIQADWNQTTTTAASFIKNKPAIPASQVQSNWTQTNTILSDYIQNKPTIVTPVQADWNESASGQLSYINNKPTIPSAQVQSNWNETSGSSPSFVQNKPTIVSPVQADWSQSSAGALSFINNKPSIPAAQVNSDWNSVAGVSQVLNKPTIPSSQVNSDWNSVSGLSQILNKPSIPAVQVQSDWNQTNAALLSFIQNKPPVRSQSSQTRSLNTAFQISTTRDALVNYSVDIGTTLSLTTGQTGTVFLEIASDFGFTINVQELGRSVNGNGGTLTIGLNLTQTATATLTGYVPTNYYCRIRTANTVSTPTFTYRSGQEILM